VVKSQETIFCGAQANFREIPKTFFALGACKDRGEIQGGIGRAWARRDEHDEQNPMRPRKSIAKKRYFSVLRAQVLQVRS
jgi:hypothetical protein